MIDLKEERTKANMTQLELAEKCGVIRTTITEIETGRNKPSVKLAKKIGEVLNLEWTEFFKDEE